MDRLFPLINPLLVCDIIPSPGHIREREEKWNGSFVGAGELNVTEEKRVSVDLLFFGAFLFFWKFVNSQHMENTPAGFMKPIPPRDASCFLLGVP